MRSDDLSLIGKKIKEIRKKKKLNLFEVGSKSDITAGLLSKIENFRALPSLPVLHRIAIALDVQLSELVSMVHVGPETVKYRLIKKNERDLESRDDSPELIYEGVLSSDVTNMHQKTTVVTVPSKTYRKPTSTDAIEQVFVVSGAVTYVIGDDVVDLNEGDTLEFDGNIPHSVENKSEDQTILFKIYLFKLQI